MSGPYSGDVHHVERSECHDKLGAGPVHPARVVRVELSAQLCYPARRDLPPQTRQDPVQLAELHLALLAVDTQQTGPVRRPIICWKIQM